MDGAVGPYHPAVADSGARRALLATRPGLGWWPALVRVAAGVTLIAVSLSKFTRHEELVESFERYGLPWPDASVYLAGTIELCGGVLFVLGLVTRLAALAVTGSMVVALATGGRVDVDLYHVGLGAALLAAALFLLWSGAGPWSIDERLVRRDRQPVNRP
jgi:putative oxidoreductase